MNVRRYLPCLLLHDREGYSKNFAEENDDGGDGDCVVDYAYDHHLLG